MLSFFEASLHLRIFWKMSNTFNVFNSVNVMSYKHCISA